jgi:hypothetical protein
MISRGDKDLFDEIMQICPIILKKLAGKETVPQKILESAVVQFVNTLKPEHLNRIANSGALDRQQMILFSILLEQVTAAGKMTDQEKEAQRRSFVYGNTKIDNDLITRETVDRAARELATDTGDKSLIQTAIGGVVDLAEPDPEQISIHDISFALSRICRFGGHISPALGLYSVAQHSVIVSRLCPPEMSLIGLLHDATEAYLGDLVTPLKNLLPAYRDLEIKWALAIGQRFGLGDALANLPAEVKHADRVAFMTERRDVLAPLIPDYPNPFAYFDRQVQEGTLVPTSTRIIPLESPFLAHKLFMDEFQRHQG